MKKLAIRYLLEFLVIVCGISISFYIEKSNLNSYNEKLKNISLKKIYKNLSQDIDDLEYNLMLHQDAAFSGQQIINRGGYLFKNQKDSLGYHLSLITSGVTFFLDNSEEYSGMKNSGLIELIENQDLVSSLQTRYAETKIFIVIDEIFTSAYSKLKEYTFKKISNDRMQYPKFYGPLTYGSYIGDKPIDTETMNYIIEKTGMHDFYLEVMKIRIEEDKKIIKLIADELKVDLTLSQKNSWSKMAD